jgi:hypothetical protein
MTKDQIGDFAVFIQSSSTADSSTSVYVEQQIGEIPLGLYRVSFKYALRPNNSAVTTYIELVKSDGKVIEIGSVNTTATSQQTFFNDFSIDETGSYAFRFRQPCVKSDRSNIFEGVTLFVLMRHQVTENMKILIPQYLSLRREMK